MLAGQALLFVAEGAAGDVMPITSGAGFDDNINSSQTGMLPCEFAGGG